MENNNWWWRKLEAVLARARARMDEANEVAWRDCLEAEVKKGYRSEFSIDLDFLSLSCRATEARRRRSVVVCFSSFPSLFINFPLSFLQPLSLQEFVRGSLACISTPGRMTLTWSRASRCGSRGEAAPAAAAADNPEVALAPGWRWSWRHLLSTRLAVLLLLPSQAGTGQQFSKCSDQD